MVSDVCQYDLLALQSKLIIEMEAFKDRIVSLEAKQNIEFVLQQDIKLDTFRSK